MPFSGTCRPSKRTTTARGKRRTATAWPSLTWATVSAKPTCACASPRRPTRTTTTCWGSCATATCTRTTRPVPWLPGTAAGALGQGRPRTVRRRRQVARPPGLSDPRTDRRRHRRAQSHEPRQLLQAQPAAVSVPLLPVGRIRNFAAKDGPPSRAAAALLPLLGPLGGDRVVLQRVRHLLGGEVRRRLSGRHDWRCHLLMTNRRFGGACPSDHKIAGGRV